MLFLLCQGLNCRSFLWICTEHALLTEKELDGAKQVMYNYVVTTGRALERRFPEMDLVV